MKNINLLIYSNDATIKHNTCLFNVKSYVYSTFAK